MTDVRTEAAQRYVAEFEAFSANGASAAPTWLQDRRRIAMAAFAERGFPSTRQEEWRFTDVKPIAREEFELAEKPADDLVSAEELSPALLGVEGWMAACVNGHFLPGLSSLDSLPAGVRVTGIEAALADDPALLERHLGQYAKGEKNPFTSLSTAFTRDGAFVYVPKDIVLDRPIQIVHAGRVEGKRPPVWHPRTLVVVERGAQVSVVETYLGLSDSAYWTNAVTEVVLGENANVDTYRVQLEGPRAFHTATTQSYQGRSSVFSSIAFTFGGALTRHDLNAVIDGEGAEATLDGLSLVAGRQHVDYHTTLDHAKPHCTSWEFFNGVFDDRARGVFSGRIIVRQNAQKTDSKQTNNNLLLSQHARADSQPQLEIYADDVRCTHGATLGPIDDKQLFYLRSRGLSLDDARALLTYGFASEILSNVTLDSLRRGLDRVVRERLQGMLRAG
jgi:Fe-S cluster assembly protein SufD